MARLAPEGDAAQALATRGSWPGESRLPRPAARNVGSALSAAQAAADVVTVLSGSPNAEDQMDPEERLRSAGLHWRRANVLPVSPLTGTGIDSALADPRAAAVARRLAVLADDAKSQDKAAFGFLTLVVRALAGEWPRKRREVEMPVLFDRRSTGGHGVLRLTLLEDGPPGLYPDPRAMLFLVADGRFAEALDVAWRAAAPPLGGRCVVWRLTTDDLPCDEVAGGSLGAAFGVGLADLARRTPPALRVRRLDRRCAVTAELRPDARLVEVSGIRNKLEEAVRQRLRVILAPSRDRDALPDPLLHDAKVRFAVDLPAAVRHSRTRVNPTFAAMIAALVLASAGLTGGVLADARKSRAAHLREVANNLLPAADTIRQSDPTSALLLEALAVQLDASGARAALIRSLLANRYIGTLADTDSRPCGGPQAWSADGTRVLTVRPRTVMVWDTARRTIDRAIEAPGQVTGCAFAPDGKTIALAVDDRLALVPLDRRPSPGPAVTMTSVSAQRVHYAPNGVLATMTQKQPVRLWSVADRGRPRLLGAVAATISQQTVSDLRPLLAFSRDSRTLVFGERERVVLADVARPDSPRVTGSIPVFADSLALSSRGVLAVGRTDGVTDLWDVRDPSRPRRTDTLRSRQEIGLRVSSVAFTPDGLHLVTAADGSSEIWRLGDATPRPLRTLAVTAHQVTGVNLAPDGETALVSDASGSLTFWRLSDQTSPPTVATLPMAPANITGMVFQADAARLVVTAAGGAATVWDVSDVAYPRRIRTVGPRDGRGTPVPFRSDSHAGSAWPTAFGADGRRYASTDDKGGISVWSVHPDGRIDQTAGIPRTADAALLPLALSPDGTLLVARTSENNTAASLWDIRDHPRLVARLPMTADLPTTAFTPDGRTLVTVANVEKSAGQDTATWWNISDPARPVRVAQRRFTTGGRGPGPIVFTPDGRLMFVAVGTGPGVLWDISDLASPELLTTQPPPNGADSHHAMLQGHTLILSATGAINVWDVTDPEKASEAAVFASGDESPFYRLFAVAPTGLLATAQLAGGVQSLYTNETLVRLRDLKPILDIVADPTAAACRVAGHDLSPELWQKYAPDLQYRPVCR
ncbi:WD40 repeat domain-containing protein [Micromonospora rhizosphaerae]|nr:WD40 repeat domain-containing protein [Micromonospora rhizosphaerae]